MTRIRLVILGATGDLTGRYLHPALAELAAAGALPHRLEVIGVAREPWDVARFSHHAAEQLALHAPEIAEAGRQAVVSRRRYLPADVTDPSALTVAVSGSPGPVVAYLALPPTLFAPAISPLADAPLPADSRIVVEKPFGTALSSARSLNHLLPARFPETAVFRMDHFLGQQTVQNVLGIRFANRIFELVWNHTPSSGLTLVWDEIVALEGRAGYYDEAGALRDMIQNHLLQLLCLVAMERPVALGQRELRDCKVQLLRQVGRLSAEEVAVHTYGPVMAPATSASGFFPPMSTSPAWTPTEVPRRSATSPSSWTMTDGQGCRSGADGQGPGRRRPPHRRAVPSGSQSRLRPGGRPPHPYSLIPPAPMGQGSLGPPPMQNGEHLEPLSLKAR